MQPRAGSTGLIEWLHTAIANAYPEGMLTAATAAQAILLNATSAPQRFSSSVQQHASWHLGGTRLHHFHSILARVGQQQYSPRGGMICLVK